VLRAFSATRCSWVTVQAVAVAIRSAASTVACAAVAALCPSLLACRANHTVTRVATTRTMVRMVLSRFTSGQATAGFQGPARLLARC
jgi:hypothetical protein